MTNTYDTSNEPLGSTAVKVLYNNASNLDDAVNGTALTWVDRPPFSRVRKSWAGIEQDVRLFLENSGYEFIGDYDTDGPLLIERPSQIFSKDGEYWRAAPPPPGPGPVLPYTTVNNWAVDQPKFVSIGDAALRAQLASQTGAEYVQHQGSLASEIFDGQGFATGLDATGGSSITLALQVALNTRRVVKLPAGDFKMTGKVTMNSNNVLIGAGMEATRLFRDITVPNFDMFEVISKTSVSIQDMWLDAVQKETVTDGAKRRSAIRCWDNGTAVNSQRIRIKGVRFSKFTSAENQPEGIRGVIALQKCVDVEVSGCTFDDNRSTAIFWWDSDDVRAHHNVYIGEQTPYDPFGRVGSFTSGWANGQSVIGNRCTGSGYTMINVSGSGVIVSGNDIDSPGFSGVTIAEIVPAAQGVVVANNNIRNPGLDGISSCEVDGFAYTGNVIKGAATAARGGIYFFSTIGGNSSKNGKVSANDISGCAAGIRMQGGVSIDIGDNRIARNSVGMLVSNRIADALLVYIHGNTFENNTSYGAQFGDTSQTGSAFVDLVDNTFVTTDIANFQATGIVTQNAATTLRLGSNTWDAAYATEFVETVFANRATKAFLNLAGTLSRLKQTVGVPMGATIAYPGSGSIADGAGANAALTVANAVVGDKVTWSHSVAIPIGVLVEAFVTAANTVTVRFQNESGGAATVPAGNLSVTVSRP